MGLVMCFLTWNRSYVDDRSGFNVAYTMRSNDFIGNLWKGYLKSNQKFCGYIPTDITIYYLLTFHLI